MCGYDRVFCFLFFHADISIKSIKVHNHEEPADSNKTLQLIGLLQVCWFTWCKNRRFLFWVVYREPSHIWFFSNVVCNVVWGGEGGDIQICISDRFAASKSILSPIVLPCKVSSLKSNKHCHCLKSNIWRSVPKTFWKLATLIVEGKLEKLLLM